MRITTDGFIKTGFWSQVALLALVDWGALLVFMRTPHVPWYHWIGFISMNVILLYSTWVMWKWMRPLKSKPIISPNERAKLAEDAASVNSTES